VKATTDDKPRLERWGWYSVAVNIVLALLHGLIALLSGSLAVAAELIHNLVDLLTAVAVLIGLRLAAPGNPNPFPTVSTRWRT